ncbi:MAG: class I SAM-dependent methyltransferase [Promethearchaeota archaeon]
MESDADRWLKELAVPFLKRVGIEPKQKVLDFGCGPGFYAVPVARIVGKRGRVFALDKSAKELRLLEQRAVNEGLSNIEILQTSGELVIPLNDDQIDICLLYDVIHSHYFTHQRRLTLLKEIQRVLKAGGLLSVYPSHMDFDTSRRLVESMGFECIETIQATLLHFYSLKEDQILNFLSL